MPRSFLKTKKNQFKVALVIVAIASIAFLASLPKRNQSNTITQNQSFPTPTLTKEQQPQTNQQKTLSQIRKTQTKYYWWQVQNTLNVKSVIWNINGSWFVNQQNQVIDINKNTLIKQFPKDANIQNNNEQFIAATTNQVIVLNPFTKVEKTFSNKSSSAGTYSSANVAYIQNNSAVVQNLEDPTQKYSVNNVEKLLGWNHTETKLAALSQNSLAILNSDATKIVNSKVSNIYSLTFSKNDQKIAAINNQQVFNIETSSLNVINSTNLDPDTQKAQVVWSVDGNIIVIEQKPQPQNHAFIYLWDTINNQKLLMADTYAIPNGINILVVPQVGNQNEITITDQKGQLWLLTPKKPDTYSNSPESHLDEED